MQLCNVNINISGTTALVGPSLPPVFTLGFDIIVCLFVWFGFFFHTGLTISALLYVVTWVLIYKHLKTIGEDELGASGKRSLVAVLVMQCLAALGLALLAIFDTRDFPTVHLIR